jgi:vancomycin resistance protein YoaR
VTNNNNTLQNYFPATLVAVALALIVFALPHSAKASSPFDQLPVPTYSPVVSTSTSTTANVPANLVKEWRGLYTKQSASLLTHSIPQYDDTLKEYIVASFFNKPHKPATKTYKFNPAAVYAWTNQIANSVNATASEPAIKVVNGRVTEFTPPQTGKALDRYTNALKIIEELSRGNTSIELTVHSTQPTKSLESMNNLGLKELIGRGESKFNGSPANRRWNIRVGVQKMTGIIVKPGEEFSFNKYLGPVEASTGFKPELVIKAEGTIPEFGGGLCQVSSTAFRAAMHAGLPITARRNHSYAVQYYAPQGTDATIYPGSADLKFTNDTGHNILIWPYFKDENYLVFDFYGQFDGRKVELGTPYSYDKKGDGSMKSTWTRKVTKKGEQAHNDTFNSVYQPPAKFHKTESFVSTNGQQSTTPNTPGGVIPYVGTPPPTNSNTNTNSNSNTP